MVKKSKLRYFVRAATIASLYFVITFFTKPLSFGAIQVRIAESLTVLPYIFPEAIWGLTIGCFLANIFSPFGPIDMILGTFLTFIAALLTMEIGKHSKSKYLAPIPPIIFNAFGVAFYIIALSGLSGKIGFEAFKYVFVNFKLVPYFLGVLTIGLGEAFSTYGLGLPILSALQRRVKTNEI